MKYFIIVALIWFHQIANGQNHFVLKEKNLTRNEVKSKVANLNNSTVQVNKSEITILESEKVVKHISRSKVPSKLNSFIFSNDKKNFVAYEEGENGIKELFFFKDDGTLLAQQKINIYPNIRFSNNDEHVTVFNNFGRQIFIFSKFGSLLFEGDYINLIGDKSKVLHAVFTSENANEIIVNAGEDLYLIDSKNKQLKFKTNSGRVLDSQFYSNQNKLLIKTPAEENNKYELKLISKAGGIIIENLKNIEKINFTKTGFIIERDSILDEYEIK